MNYFEQLLYIAYWYYILLAARFVWVFLVFCHIRSVAQILFDVTAPPSDREYATRFMLRIAENVFLHPPTMICATRFVLPVAQNGSVWPA